MKSVVAKLNLNTQDVEEGQLPSYPHQQPINATFHSQEQPRKTYQAEQRPHNRTAETAVDQHPLLEHKPLNLHHPQREIEYETIKSKSHAKDCSHSPEKKKKSHKSDHKSKHHHRSNGHDPQRQKQIKRYDRREPQIEGNYQETRRNHNANQERLETGEDAGMKPEYYPPHPYYPPYMYPPPPHIPPPNMYHYQYPPPYGPPGSYPYPPLPIMPPMHMPYQPEGFYNQKGAQKNEYLPPAPDQCPPPFQGPETERPVPSERQIEKSGESNYKMFGMGRNYMYPYPPPPLAYPGYPPPPYMMYPPQPYDSRGYYDEQDDQLRSWRRRQLVDNQKQRVRKALKHLSAETKIEMLDTVRVVVKLGKMTLEANSNELSESYSNLKQSDNISGGAIEKCYQRNLIKIEKWLRGPDDRVREAMGSLLVAFQLEGIKERLKELKEKQRIQSSSLQSVAKRLIDRLIISKRQAIF